MDEQRMLSTSNLLYELEQQQDLTLMEDADKSVDLFIDQLKAADERMRRLAARLIDNDATVDDVLQIAYAKAYRKRESFGGRSQFETWLYTIVYRSCLDHLRSSRHHLPLDAAAANSQNGRAATVNQLQASADDRLTLEQALASLPTVQRAAIWLVDVEGYTFAEAAAVLDEPAGTVASRVSRARTRLRGLLATEFGGDQL